MCKRTHKTQRASENHNRGPFNDHPFHVFSECLSSLDVGSCPSCRETLVASFSRQVVGQRGQDLEVEASGQEEGGEDGRLGPCQPQAEVTESEAG